MIIAMQDKGVYFGDPTVLSHVKLKFSFVPIILDISFRYFLLHELLGLMTTDSQ
jgi:hypothetical protein